MLDKVGSLPNKTVETYLSLLKGSNSWSENVAHNNTQTYEQWAYSWDWLA